MDNPVSDLNAEERSLEALVWGGGAGLLWLLSQVPERELRAAVRSGRVRPLIGSRAWVEALREARARFGEVLRPIYRRGFDLGLQDIPGYSPSSSAVRDVVAALASGQAVVIVAELGRGTRLNLRRMLRNASARYDRSPSTRLLDQLVREVRLKLGTTPGQARQLEVQVRAMRRAGASLAEIWAFLSQRVGSRLQQRASATATYGAVAAINFGMLAAWRMAQDEGFLDAAARKQWQHVRDGKARTTHRLQTELGPVPLHAVYPLHGVMAPPAPEIGCRCWHVLVV